jgi:glycosyltransferase involved in cell wall biosynthesis
MHILMFHPHDLFTEPWTIRIIKLAEVMVQKGHRVTLCYFPSRERREEGLIVRETLPQGPEYLEFGKKRRDVPSNLARASALARTADVIHVQKSYLSAFIPAFWAARRAGLPLHYDWDDDEAGIARYWVKSTLGRWKIELAEVAAPHLATTVSVASGFLRDLAKRRGVRDACLFDAPVGADLTEFDARASLPCVSYPQVPGVKFWVLYVGQLEGANYASLLIDAFAGVVKVRKDIGLLIVGGGFGLAALERQIAELTLQERVFLTGYVTHESIPSIMANGDIGVACLADTPNARAKSPLKVVEYLAAGMPVVGTAVGEINRMIDGCGVLVPSGDSSAMRDAIIGLIDDPARRHELSKRARQRVHDQYNWERTAERLLAAYAFGRSIVGRS